MPRPSTVRPGWARGLGRRGGGSWPCDGGVRAGASRRGGAWTPRFPAARPGPTACRCPPREGSALCPCAAARQPAKVSAALGRGWPPSRVRQRARARSSPHREAILRLPSGRRVAARGPRPLPRPLRRTRETNGRGRAGAAPLRAEVLGRAALPFLSSLSELRRPCGPVPPVPLVSLPRAGADFVRLLGGGALRLYLIP